MGNHIKRENENEKRQNMSEKLLVYDPKEADVAPNVALVAQKVLRNPLAHLITIISLPRNCIEDVGIIVANCINVEWLNVEGNLISELPPPGAMGQCKNLKIVNLHHNGIHRVESLISLASLPRLVGLTLYNCPIYKRAGYRHHTVNTIWSLKALDHYVLSDEEIIEGAEFKNTRFESMASSLKINLNPSEKTNQMSEKHAQKFAEYYLKLEKELLKYNINVTRASTLSKKRHVREAVRHDSELGAVKQVDKLNQKLRHWDEINTQFKVALELDRERVQTRHRAEKAMNVKKIKTMNMAKVATEAQNVRPHWSMPTLPIL